MSYYEDCRDMEAMRGCPLDPTDLYGMQFIREAPLCALKVGTMLSFCFYEHNSHKPWPDTETLMNDTNMSKRSVVRGIKWLEANGHVEVRCDNGVKQYVPVLRLQSVDGIVTEISSNVVPFPGRSMA